MFINALFSRNNRKLGNFILRFEFIPWEQNDGTISCNRLRKLMTEFYLSVIQVPTYMQLIRHHWFKPFAILSVQLGLNGLY